MTEEQVEFFQKELKQLRSDITLQQAQHRENTQHFVDLSRRQSRVENSINTLELEITKNYDLLKKGNEDNQKIISFLQNANLGFQIVVGSAKFIRWLSALILAIALILTGWNAIKNGKIPLIGD